jgi:hypothetical protein
MAGRKVKKHKFEIKSGLTCHSFALSAHENNQKEEITHFQRQITQKEHWCL